MKAKISKIGDSEIDVELAQFWQLSEDVGMLTITFSTKRFLFNTLIGLTDEGDYFEVSVYPDESDSDDFCCDTTKIRFTPETDAEKHILIGLYSDMVDKHDLFFFFIHRMAFKNAKVTNLELEK